MRIYKPVIRFSLTYSIETRKKTIKIRQQTEESKMKVLRRLTRKMKRDREK